MANNDFQLLMEELDDLAEKISTCNGPESTKALIAKLNELNNKYNENLIREQKNKFNKTLYDAIHTYYKMTGEETISIHLEDNCGNSYDFDIKDACWYNGDNEPITLIYES